MKTAGIIPARYGSTRLPGKPLLEIQGRPMVWWVYERARRARRLAQVWVATDDPRIEETCRGLQIPVVMTGREHRTAAERLQEAAQQVKAALTAASGPSTCPGRRFPAPSALSPFPIISMWGSSATTGKCWTFIRPLSPGGWRASKG